MTQKFSKEQITEDYIKTCHSVNSRGSFLLSFSIEMSSGNIPVTTNTSYVVHIQPTFSLANLQALKLLKMLQSSTTQSLIAGPHFCQAIYHNIYWDKSNHWVPCSTLHGVRTQSSRLWLSENRMLTKIIIMYKKQDGNGENYIITSFIIHILHHMLTTMLKSFIGWVRHTGHIYLVNFSRKTRREKK